MEKTPARTALHLSKKQEVAHDLLEHEASLSFLEVHQVRMTFGVLLTLTLTLLSHYVPPLTCQQHSTYFVLFCFYLFWMSTFYVFKSIYIISPNYQEFDTSFYSSEKHFSPPELISVCYV